MSTTNSELTLATKITQFSDALRQKASVPQKVAQFVHDLIISGELNPGDRIVEWRLAKQLGIGHPTVREALLSLEHIGLVVRTVNQGCMVTQLTSPEVAQILQVRIHLEVFAAELAAEAANEQQCGELTRIATQMLEAGRAGNVEEFYRADLRFHQAVWAMSGNEFLAKSLFQTVVPLLSFCMLKNLRDRGYLDMVKSAKAHEEIAEAVVSGDPKLARRIMRRKLKVFATQHMKKTLA